MYKCLLCGKTAGRSKKSTHCKTPGCIGHTVSVCKHTANLAVLLNKIGLNVDEASIRSLRAPVAAEEDLAVAPNGWRVNHAFIEFCKQYNKDMFCSLPEGWEYTEFKRISDDKLVSAFAYFAIVPYISLSEREVNKIYKTIMQPLEEWAKSPDREALTAVLTFMG